MTSHSDSTSYRYKAFISYSHHDSKFAKYLHTKLESYPSLDTGSKTVKKPLSPIFIDESELIAGSMLSEAIKNAIQSSEFFIVICSQHSALSHWVKTEMAFMQDLHEHPQIIGVIPPKSGDESHLDALFGKKSEHLAADFRRGNNKHLQLSKIAATMTGTELDKLYRRDSRKKNKQMTALGLGLSSVALLTSTLATKAYLAQKEAVRQRQQSEQVIAFMIDEFHEDLESLDKLDLLVDVGERAQEYFDDRDLSLLSDDSIILQSRTLRQLSVVDEKRGNLVASKARLESAYKASELIMRRQATNRTAIYEHAQNAAMWGYLDYQIGDLQSAKDMSLEAMRTYEKGLVHFPEDDEFLWKKTMAEQQIGVMILQSGKATEARPFFERALDSVREINKNRNLSEEQLYEYSHLYSWYIRSLPDNTHLSVFYDTRQKQLELFKQIESNASRLIQNQSEKLNVERAIVILLLNMGREDEAETLMLSIQEQFKKLLQHDSENIGWRRHLMRSKLSLARLQNKNNNEIQRNQLLADVLSLQEKPDGGKWLLTTDITLGINRLNARKLYDDGFTQVAIESLAKAEKSIRDYRKDKIRPRDKYNMASLNSLKAELYEKEGRISEARKTQNYVLELLDGKDSYTIAEHKLKLRAYVSLKMRTEEMALREKFDNRGLVVSY